MTGETPTTVLWAEDNPRDRFLIQESLESFPDRRALVLVDDGVRVLEALGEALPALVVLDLKMPRRGGIEVLRAIRQNPAWRGLPVTIFTSGNRPSEISECSALGVRAVVEKPVDFDRFSAAVFQIMASARLGAAADPRASTLPGVTETNVR